MESLAESTLLSQPCHGCDRPIDAISPGWFRIEWDFANGRIAWEYDPDETAMCSACAVAAASDTERAGVLADLNAQLRRKMAARVPADVTLFRLETTNTHQWGPVGGVVQERHFFVLGTGPLPTPCEAPWVQLPEWDRWALYLGWDMRIDGIPAVARITWDATDLSREGDLRIDGWSKATHSELMRLMETTRALRERRRSGRPHFSFFLQLEDYQRMYRDAVTALGRPPKTEGEFAKIADFRIDTFRRNRRVAWALSWSEFRKTATPDLTIPEKT